MCTQDCRTWLWGGEGNPTYDGGGQCSCVCENERWSDHNLLGRASCVPVMAHLIFGWAGLALSVAALWHSVHQLNRQLQFHAQELLASALPAERCRRLQHSVVITTSVMCLLLFSLMLGDELRWSGVLVSAIHIPSNISGLMAIRIWIYTTGRGLINQTPEMLALSAWLETPAGHYASCSAVSIVPVAAIILAAIDHPEAAIKMTAAGMQFFSAIVSGSFWICGKALIRVMDESIEKKRKAREGAKIGNHGDDGDETLLAAKNKVKGMLGFVSRQLVLMSFILGFACFSKYGTAAPLLLFDIPVVVMTIIKLMVAVQLFAGRSKVDASPGLRYVIGGKLRLSRTMSLTNLRNSISRKGQVVPIEKLSPLNHRSENEVQHIYIV